MLRFCPLLLLILASCTTAADDPKHHPARVLLIRHGEKPTGDDAAKTGLDDDGKKRAKGLHKLFDGKDARFPKPDFIFATADSGKSHRPRKTVEPLAKSLGLEVDLSFKNSPEGIAGRSGLMNAQCP